jgi:hypothetical protein
VVRDNPLIPYFVAKKVKTAEAKCSPQRKYVKKCWALNVIIWKQICETDLLISKNNNLTTNLLINVAIFTINFCN